MERTGKQASEVAPSAANDNGSSEGAQPAEPLDPRIRVIVRAIGRHIAREHIKAWEEERRKQAANDNRRE